MFLHYDFGKLEILSYRRPEHSATVLEEVLLAMDYLPTNEKLVASVDADSLDALSDGAYLEEIGATLESVETLYNLINDNLNTEEV